MSPAKQVPFLLSVLLSTEEPETSRELDEVGWKRVTGVVENLFSVYMLLYMPRDEELGLISAGVASITSGIDAGLLELLQ